MIRDIRLFGIDCHASRILELGLSLFIGILLGALVIVYPDIPLPADFRKLVLVIPFAFTVAILFNNLERLILFTLAISVPSILISL